MRSVKVVDMVVVAVVVYVEVKTIEPLTLFTITSSGLIEVITVLILISCNQSGLEEVLPCDCDNRRRSTLCGGRCRGRRCSLGGCSGAGSSNLRRFRGVASTLDTVSRAADVPAPSTVLRMSLKVHTCLDSNVCAESPPVDGTCVALAHTLAFRAFLTIATGIAAPPTVVGVVRGVGMATAGSAAACETFDDSISDRGWTVCPTATTVVTIAAHVQALSVAQGPAIGADRLTALCCCILECLYSTIGLHHLVVQPSEALTGQSLTRNEEPAKRSTSCILKTAVKTVITPFEGPGRTVLIIA